MNLIWYLFFESVCLSCIYFNIQLRCIFGFFSHSYCFVDGSHLFMFITAVSAIISFYMQTQLCFSYFWCVFFVLPSRNAMEVEKWNDEWWQNKNRTIKLVRDQAYIGRKMRYKCSWTKCMLVVSAMHTWNQNAQQKEIENERTPCKNRSSWLDRLACILPLCWWHY